MLRSGSAVSPVASRGTRNACGRPVLRRDHQHRIRAVDPRHEALGAVEDVVVAVAARRRLRAERIRVEARLHPRERTRHEARPDEARKLALLFIRSEFRNWKGTEAWREDRERDGEIADRQLLRDQRARHRAAFAAAAGRLRQRVRDEPQLVRLLDHLLRQLLRLVALARPRADLVRREVSHGVDDELLFVRRLEVDQGRFSLVLMTLAARRWLATRD